MTVTCAILIALLLCAGSAKLNSSADKALTESWNDRVNDRDNE